MTQTLLLAQRPIERGDVVALGRRQRSAEGAFGKRLERCDVFRLGRLPVLLDPADARELWISAGRFPLLEVGRRSGGRGPGLPDLAAVSAPVTLVWGTRDLFVPSWMHRRWEAALPQADDSAGVRAGSRIICASGGPPMLICVSDNNTWAAA